jgi:hypothetical protein
MHTDNRQNKRVGMGAVGLAAVTKSKFEIPADNREKIARAHNEVIGHSGVQRTRKLLLENGENWNNMNAHVRQFVSECGYCQKAAFRTPPVHTAPFVVSTLGPMTTRATDVLGPFPLDEEGFSHIGVISCPFSRHVSLYPLKGETAVEYFEAALHPHCGLFGPPQHLISDNGGQFVSDLIKRLQT